MTTPQRDLALSPAILLLRMLQSVELGHDSLMAEQRTNCVRRLRALLKPIEHLLLIDVDYRRLLRGVVVSDNLDETTVTRRARIGYDDAGDTPNEFFAYFDTGKIPVVFRISNLPDKNDPKSAGACAGPSSGYVVYCEGGRYEKHWGGAVAFDADGKKMREFEATSEHAGPGPHLTNFVDAIQGWYGDQAKNGSKGAGVKAAQQSLIDRGFLAGSADGSFGPKTEAAVKLLQETYGLEPDGVIQGKTLVAVYFNQTAVDAVD